MKRYLEECIREDLKDKMVFVGGPRQVGKTTMSFSFLKDGNESSLGYLNWDFLENKKDLAQGVLPGNEKLIVLDEIHKFRNWRNLVKGFYDKYKNTKQFLITGSARLDYYRKGGDSLQGRYHYYRLHPLSLMELSKNPSKEDLQTLLKFGGFPEPFFKSNLKHWKRWQRERLARVIQDDLINLEHVKEISQIGLLVSLLPDKVGSPLSISNIREDLSVAFETTDRWINILENLYYCFRIMPYGSPKLRAMKKEKKLYLWDWSLCPKDGAKFENFVASHLLKYCHFHEDSSGDEMELRFLRDSNKREIDFVVLRDKKPIFAVECKSGDKQLSEHIKYFSAKTEIPRFFQVHLGTKDFEQVEFKARVLPFKTFCRELELV